MTLNIEVVFENASFENALDLMVLLVSADPKHESMVMVYNRKGRPVKLGNLIKKLQTKTVDSFSLETEESEIVFLNNGHYQFGHLLMDNIIMEAAEADTWLSPIFEHPSFLQARVYEDDYDTWQNAVNLDYYRVNNKSLEGLALVHNGSPPPLDAMEVDVSNHPGRKVFRYGYLEMLGSPMWISRKMLDMVDSDMAGLKNLDWLSITEVSANVIKLERKDGVFCSGEGEQREQQDILRSLLYRKVIDDPTLKQDQTYPDHATEITIDGETFVRKEKRQ